MTLAHIRRPARTHRRSELTVADVSRDGTQIESMFEKAAAPKHYIGAHVASREVQTGTCGEAKSAETSACVTFREIEVETQKALRA